MGVEIVENEPRMLVLGPTTPVRDNSFSFQSPRACQDLYRARFLSVSSNQEMERIV